MPDRLSPAFLKLRLGNLMREHSIKRPGQLRPLLRTREGKMLQWHDPADVLLAVVAIEHSLHRQP